jgi:regulator of protease activity HflC (stomatin/prohibitin superfamily)
MGAIMLGMGAALASGICTAGVLLGYRWKENTGAWIGLVAGMILAGALGAWLLGKFIRGRSRWFIAGLWFGYCTLGIAGYLAGGWIGLLTITLPAMVVFWIGLYRISAYALPLRDRHNRKEHIQAFKSILTFTMGTNYPYYFVKDGKAEKRIDGNPYNQFFAGPGLVYTDCDYAAYVTDGVKVKGVFEPGLTFMGMFDLEPKILDLRTQLRPFHVEAVTKDGIPIRVLTFIPFRIRPHPRKEEVRPGGSFSFQRQAVYSLIASELIERKRKKEVSGEKHEWDGQLIPLLTARILQDIISRYDVDELCAPFDPGRDPRIEIVEEMKKKLEGVLQPLGLDLVGGGISNLIPLDETVNHRRLDTWKTEWVRKILIYMGKGKAERTRQIEEARGQAEAEIVLKLGQVFEQSLLEGDISQTALALRFIDCLGEIVSETETQWPLPGEIEETLKCLRGEIVEGQR